MESGNFVKKKLNFSNAFFLCQNFRLLKRPKDMKVEKLEICPTDKDSPIIMEHFDIIQQARQKYALNATMRIVNEVNSHLYVSTDWKETI